MYRISSNNFKSRGGDYYFFSTKRERLFQGGNYFKHSPLNQKMITSNKIDAGFFSAPNLVLWLLFNVNILGVGAWIVTDEFCRFRWVLRRGYGIRVRVLYCLAVLFMRRSREKSGYKSIPSRLRRSRKSCATSRQLSRLIMAVLILEDV